jgi:hypothetical protein
MLLDDRFNRTICIASGAQQAAHEINPNTHGSVAKRRTERKRKIPMLKPFDDMQKTSNANVDATIQSFEGVTKATQAIATEVADYSKRSFENGTKTMENLLGAKSLDRAFEVQSEYAKAAYESYVSHASKLGELYTDLAKEAFNPYQSFTAKVTPVTPVK